MESIDITVIGAGIVGLAVSAELSGENRELFVIEKHHSYGQETSSRNSEVVHAGIYYPPGSLKARTCVEGNRMIYEICEKNGITCINYKKLIAAVTEEGLGDLEDLYKNGIENDVKGLKILTREEIKNIEPEIKCAAAIYSPTTGVVDSHGLMKHFYYSAKNNGAEVSFNSKLTGIEKKSNGFTLKIEDSDGEIFEFETRILINCAGLECDTVAEMTGIDIDKAGYRLHYCKGNYFYVGNGKNKLISHLIYPLPTKISLGIHTRLDIGGELRLGPDAEYIDRNNFNYDVDESKKEKFYDGVKDILPFIEIEDLNPDMSGVRPKLQKPGEEMKDFVITDEAAKGLPGFINLIGIESPGLTAAPSIARYVKDILKDYL